MTNTKHTPTTWRVQHMKGECNGQLLPIVANNCGLGIAYVATDEDAKLITAAPEMLEALQWAVQLMTEGQAPAGCAARCKEVIAKATGGTQ